MTNAQTRMVALLEPVVEALGYELTDLELNFSGRRGVLRLFIDFAWAAAASGDGAVDEAGAPAGISLEDCEAVSRQVSAVLDVEDPVQRDYDLEVSSPGMDRKLIKPAHFDRFAGHAVKGRLRRVIDGRRRFTGMLVGRQGALVTIRVDGGADLTVPIDDLDVVRLKPEY